MTKIVYADATAADLRAYGESVLGLTLPKTLNLQQLRAKIAEVGTPPGEIDRAGAPVAAHADEQAQTVKLVLQTVGSKGDPMVDMTINQGSGTDGKRNVFIAVQGVSILLPRGKRFLCAYRYYEALNNAVESTWVQGTDPTAEMDEANVHAYPFQVHRMPPQEEIDAFLASSAAMAA